MEKESSPAAPTSFFHLPSSGSWLCLSVQSSLSPSGSFLPSQLRCTPASERKTSGVSVAGLGGKRQQVKCQEGQWGLWRRAPRAPLICSSSSSSCRSLLHPRLLLPDVQRLRLGRTEPHCPFHVGKLSVTLCPQPGGGRRRRAASCPGWRSEVEIYGLEAKATALSCPPPTPSRSGAWMKLSPPFPASL